MTENTFIYGFEKLEVWKKSRELNYYIYDLTDNFPYSEMKNLTSQIRRASVSISANIAEGSAKFSNKDFKRYLRISYGSALELISHFYLAFDRKYINELMLNKIKLKINEITRMLNSLSRSLET
ncbi:MAG: four helix bundle protein [Candidatus Marinimicrobia bacterium]|nr:four helix bundle protein [Candidatus Neomarinimicrobiota bacterium]